MEGADVVIIGGGTAGCVLAGELTERQPDRTVLVLEAGPVYDEATRPDSIRYLSRKLHEDHDWAHVADSVHPIPYTRGKVAGGSSSINATMAFRPVPGDVDAWGIEGWSWADLQPHFEAVERRMPLQRWADDELTEAQAWYVERCLQLGHPYEPDHNDPATKGGIGPIPMNRNGNERISAADAWLHPALGRPNLTVRGGTTVDRIDGATVVTSTGERIEAGEIIVAGGVIQTPQLLRRSGFTDPAIGANLSDHPSVPVPFIATWERGQPTVQTMLRTNDLDLMVFPTSQGQLYASPQAVDARGRVHDDGRIEWPYVSDPRTRQELRDGIALIREIGGDRVELPADLDVDAYIDAEHRAFLHGCGTAALGVVVDEQLRIEGTRIRVCDTSVLPTVPRANPALTMFAVAHRAAAFL